MIISMIGDQYIYIYIKNLEKDFSFHETNARSPRGGLTMRRTAAGRSELVERADDSASSADATTALPTSHEEQCQ